MINNQNKKIIIIGAGISGLVSAVYARHCGYEVTVYEKNPNLGGCCCGWERKGNYIDGCIHWLQGCKDDDSLLSRIWRVTGAVRSESDCYFPEDFSSMEYEGEVFTWYTDPIRLKQEMLRVAPNDEKQINRFFKQLAGYQKFNIPADKPVDMYSLFELLKIGMSMAIPYAKILLHSRLSATDYGKKFESPILRHAFKHIIADDYNMMSTFYMLGAFTSGDGGIPIGGSQEMSERIARRARALGANIITNCGVSEVIVENNMAVGVMLNSGLRDDADYVISTTDATFALNKLLKGKYKVNDFEMRNRDPETYPVYSYTLACLKVKSDIEVPHDRVIKINTDIGARNQTLSMRSFAYDRSLKSEDGTYIVQCTVIGLDDMYHYWKAQKENGTYRQRKTEIGKQFQEYFESYYPELRGKTEVIDVVTPMTYERYLNTRHGTFQGYVATKSGKPLDGKNYIKGLDNFVLSGQWIMRSGGLPTAAFTGRSALQRICDWDGIQFVEDRRQSLARTLRGLVRRKSKVVD